MPLKNEVSCTSGYSKISLRISAPVLEKVTKCERKGVQETSLYPVAAFFKEISCGSEKVLGNMDYTVVGSISFRPVCQLLFPTSHGTINSCLLVWGY